MEDTRARWSALGSPMILPQPKTPVEKKERKPRDVALGAVGAPKAIMTPNGHFDSMKEAAEAYGLGISAIAYRMKAYPEQYYPKDMPD